MSALRTEHTTCTGGPGGGAARDGDRERDALGLRARRAARRVGPGAARVGGVPGSLWKPPNKMVRGEARGIARLYPCLQMTGRGGRPSKLTRELIAKLARAVARGNYVEVACAEI